MAEKKQRAKPRPWTDKDDDTIRRMKAKGGSYAEMSAVIGRTPAAIGQRLMILGETRGAKKKRRDARGARSVAEKRVVKRKAKTVRTNGSNGHSEAAVARSQMKLEAARAQGTPGTALAPVPQVVPVMADPEAPISVIVNGLPLSVEQGTEFSIAGGMVRYGDSVFMVPVKRPVT